MCGISGILLNYSRPINHEIVQINNLLKHRGPDDEGYVLINSEGVQPFAGKDTPAEAFQNQNLYCPNELIANATNPSFLALGHRRLSIIDLSANGHQPMCTTNKQAWITFNGEIYNYIELRKELQNQGCRFYTETDTEVVLQAYNFWGQDCVTRFNGMWAFVIYDAEKNILFGSRDRLGIKPLYYVNSNTVFVFASEQKALWKCGLINSELNSRAVFDYLALSHAEPETEGFFKNIFSLKQGHNFVFYIDKFEFVESQYYSPFQNLTNQKISYNESVEKLNVLLTAAVSIRTRADVEIGSCLSGGIDSSIIVMLLDAHFKKNQPGYLPKVFTAVYPNSAIDEEKWAQQVVSGTSVDWFKTYPTGVELTDDLHDFIDAAGSPLLNTSTYAQYRVMKLASENGIKILLDGQGADELFAGYTVFLPVFYNELLFRFKLILLLNELKATGKFFKQLKTWVVTDIQMMLKRMPARISKLIYEAAVVELKYLKPDFKHAFLHRFGMLSFPFGVNLNNTLKKYAYGEKLQVMLRLEDHMSMHFSIESRTPFSDDFALLDFSMNLPAEYKIRNGLRKSVLRDAARNILPVDIANRTDKIGFQTPEFEWIKTISPRFNELIDSNINEFVDTQMVKKDLAKLVKSPTSTESSRLLRFVFFSQWRTINGI